MKAKNKSKNKAKKIGFLRAIKLFFKNPFNLCYLLFVIIVIAGTVIVYHTETKTGSGIKTKFDAFWFMCVAVFAAYFEFVCESYVGRVAAITLLITGTILFRYIQGVIASAFIEIQMKKDKGLKKLKEMKGHFILCGYRPGFEKILDNLFRSNPDITPDMLVLVNEAPDQIESLRSEFRFKEINYVAGDFTDELTLKRAFIDTASRVLVISDHSKKYSDLEVDSRTVLAVLTIENMCRGIYVAAELISSKFESHLKMAHCDEIILTQAYERSLLATASSGLGYSNVIRSLISDDADSGILIRDIPSIYVGKQYKDLKAVAWKYRKDKGVLVGLLLNSGNFHQRRKEAIREAQKNPNVNVVISNLKKVKTLKSNDPFLTPPNDFVIPKNSRAIYIRGKCESDSLSTGEK